MCRSVLNAGGALALAASILVRPALAQQTGGGASGAVALPTITVEASPSSGGSLTVPSVEQQRAAVNNTVGSVAFIDSKSFENRYTNTIRDVLKDTPGVFVQQRYGQELRLSIRGAASRLQKRVGWETAAPNGGDVNGRNLAGQRGGGPSIDSGRSRPPAFEKSVLTAAQPGYGNFALDLTRENGKWASSAIGSSPAATSMGSSAACS
jgi:hypothetical protein